MQAATHAEPAQLVIRRTYRAAPEKVWRAWTEKDALSQWFGPGPGQALTKAEIDLRVGGRYQIAFRTPGGETHEVLGLYREVVPYSLLVFSWAWISTPERVSRVTIQLRAVDTGTEMTFTHDRFVDEKARSNHERGWKEFFARLDDLLQLAPGSAA